MRKFRLNRKKTAAADPRPHEPRADRGGRDATAHLVAGPWCGRSAEIPSRVREWHLPAPAFTPTGNPELDRLDDPAATLMYRRRGNSATFEYVDAA